MQSLYIYLVLAVFWLFIWSTFFDTALVHSQEKWQLCDSSYYKQPESKSASALIFVCFSVPKIQAGDFWSKFSE